MNNNWLGDQDWRRLLDADLEKLIALSVPDQKEPSLAIELQPGERRYVTVLFLDMAGFTALAERFDHETIDTLMNKLFLIFKNQIDRRGGWVEKFEGDAILAAFGARKAHEDDAIRAVDAGWAILESFHGIEPLLQKQGLTIGLRIGIHSGEVTKSKRAEYDVITGDTVNTAARLEQNTKPGTLLISEATRALAGDHFVYESCPDVQAKGKAEPIRAHIVKGRAPRKDRWFRSRLTAKTRFVGRRQEMHVLGDLYWQCCRPRGFQGLEKGSARMGDSPVLSSGLEPPKNNGAVPSEAESLPSEGPQKHILVIVEGEAGLGKSRLIQEFARQALNQDQVFKGVAASFASRPYEMVISMVIDFLGIAEPGTETKGQLEAALEDLGKYAADPLELKKSIPMLGFLLGVAYDDPRLSHLKPDQFQKEIFIGFKTFIEAVSTKIERLHGRPLVLVWDDFHWADEPSRAALRFLLDNARTPLPMMNLILARPDQILAGMTVRSAQIHELLLLPLPISEESALVQGMLGDVQVPERVVALIRGRSSGNPYYVEEFIHHLIDRGIAYEDNGRWRFIERADIADTPISLRSLLMARIDALAEEPKKRLQHAAILGLEFFYQELKWIEDRLDSRTDPRAHLEELVTLSFLGLGPSQSETVSDDAAYHFRHILTRDVVYESLLHWNRRILHRLAAEYTESHDAENLERHAFELAEHWLAAGNAESAARYFIMAGEQSQRSYDHEGAIRAFSKAVELLPDSDRQKSQVLRARGNVYRLVGEIPEGRSDLEQSLHLARQFDDPRAEADTTLAFGSLLRQQGLSEAALQNFERALNLMHKVGDKRGEAGAIFQMGNVHCTHGRLALALECFEKALDIYRAEELRQEEAATLAGLGIIYGQQERFEEAFEVDRQSLDISRAIGDRLAQMTIHNNLGILQQIQGRYDLALPHYRESSNLSREIGDRAAASSTMVNTGIVFMELGQFDEALPLFFEALRIKKEIGDQSGQGIALSNIGTVYLLKGRNEDASKFYEQAVALLFKINMNSQAVLTQALQARALLKIGEVQRAEELSSRAIQSIEEMEAGQMGRALDPEQVYFTHYLVSSHGKNPDANTYLEKAYSLLQKRIDKINDPRGRQNILNSALSRPILEATKKLIPFS